MIFWSSFASTLACSASRGLCLASIVSGKWTQSIPWWDIMHRKAFSRTKVFLSVCPSAQALWAVIILRLTPVISISDFQKYNMNRLSLSLNIYSVNPWWRTNVSKKHLSLSVGSSFVYRAAQLACLSTIVMIASNPFDVESPVMNSIVILASIALESESASDASSYVGCRVSNE